MNDKGTCRDCALKENCAEYKENKSQCEDYESYNEVQTNEEWFCQLSTAKKAKTIKMVINTCVSCKEHGTVRTRGCLLRQNMAKGLLFLPCMDEDGIVKWLKQPHHNE